LGAGCEGVYLGSGFAREGFHFEGAGAGERKSTVPTTCVFGACGSPLAVGPDITKAVYSYW